MDAELTRRRVAEQARASLGSVGPWIGAIYGALALLYTAAPPLTPGWPYAAVSLAAALLQLALGLSARRAPLAWVHALNLAAALVSIAHALSFVALTGDPAQTVILVIVLLGAAFETFTYWMAFVTAGAAIAAWSCVAADFPPAARVHWGVNLGGAAALAIVMSVARIRAVRRQIALDEALRESEERHRLVIDTALDAVITVDPDNVVLGWNAQAERIFGWRYDEIVGLPLAPSLLAIAHRSEYERGIRQFLATGDGPFLNRRLEVTAVTRDGREFAAEMTTVPIRRGDGVVFTAFLRDITARKHAEDELRNAKNAAEQGARVKADFLATMSHEIRTPLNGIFGMTELALDTSDDAERREFLQRARACAETLMAILNDVLDFSRVEAGRMDLERIAFDPSDVVDGVLDTLALEAERKGLELIGCVDESLPAVLIGDPSRLRQILINLGANALKFTEHGEVVIRLHGDPVEADGDALALTLHGRVRDTGIGIAADKQRTIFEAFTQADSSTTRRFGGTGLGLAISQRLVALMDGTIAVASAPAAGSTFSFAIRVGIGEPTTAVTRPGAITERHLLLASAHAASRAHLEHSLRARGCRVVATPTLASVGALLDHAGRGGRRYDAIVADLPAETSEHEIAALAALDPGRTPLVVLTSAATRGELQRRHVVPTLLLAKPVKVRALLEALAALRPTAPAADVAWVQA